MAKGWTLFEKLWVALFTLVIVMVTVYFSITDTDYSNTEQIIRNWLISPVSAITGIICVVLAAKGKIATYYWGIIATSTYAYIAYRSDYTGDAIINLFWFVPMNFIGIPMWRRRMTPGSDTDVAMKKLPIGQTASLFLGTMGLTILCGMLLYHIDTWFTVAMQRNQSIYSYFGTIFGDWYLLMGPILDAATAVMQIIAQILMAFALAEQWLFWIVINIIAVLMWGVVIQADPGTIAWALPILVMWIAYLLNSIFGWMNWNKGAVEG